MREQARWLVELNKRKCSFVLLADLPGTSLEVCPILPAWLEVILLTPGKWRRALRWEGQRYDNVLELPMRRGFAYSQLLEDDGGDSYFARRSYRFGIDWVAPRGAVIAFQNAASPCRDVQGAIDYAKSQQVRVITMEIG